MKKIKIILLFSLFIYVLFIIKNEFYFSKYSNETEIEGIIINIDKKNNTTKLELKGKEKILCVLYDDINVNLGNKIKLKGLLEKPSVNTNFNLFNYKNYLLSKNIKWIFKVENYEIISTNIDFKYKIKNKIIDKINNSKNKDYLNLFILGDNSLDDNTKKKYQLLGISHLFAISGMHISFLTQILLIILNKIIKNKKINITLISLFLFFYMFLTNYSPSVIRASLLFILINFKKIFNIKISNIDILIIIFSILLIINPFYIYNVGFIFSFTISFFLMKYNKLLNKKNYFVQIFFTSLISFLVSIPIMINNFNQINLLSVLFNCFFVPYVSILLFPITLLSFIFPFLEQIVSLLICFLEFMSNFFSYFNLIIIIQKISIIYIIIYYFLIISLLNNFKKYKIILIFIYFLISLFFKNFSNKINITMLDVKQGDSILIEINNKNILIDTGGQINYFNEESYFVSENILLPYFKSLGINKIHYLILTHGDFDHMGESINLVNNFKVENVIFNCGEYNDLEKELISVLEKKNIKYYSCIKELNIDKYKLIFLNNKDYGNENDNSSVIYFNYNNYKFLFMGDAGIDKEKDILEKYNLKDIDFLKVGHHGSKTSSSKYFVDNINPKYSLISVGKNNRYGHPNKEVLNNLSNSKIYRTDEDGSVMFKIKNNKLKIETCSP